MKKILSLLFVTILSLSLAAQTCTYAFNAAFVAAGERYKENRANCTYGSAIINSHCYHEAEVQASHDVNTAISEYEACLAGNP